LLILEDSPIVGEVAPHESHQRVSAKGLELIVFLDRWADENRGDVVKYYVRCGVCEVGIEVDQMMNGSRPAVLPNLIENGPIVREEPLLRDSVKKPWAVFITGRTESARTKVELVAALIEQTLTRDVDPNMPLYLLLALGGSDEGAMRDAFEHLFQRAFELYPEMSGAVATSVRQERDLWRLREDTDAIYRAFPAAALMTSRRLCPRSTLM